MQEKIKNNQQTTLIDLTGFTILMGFLDVSLKGVGLDETIHLTITFIILVIRLIWWFSKKSTNEKSLALSLLKKLFKK